MKSKLLLLASLLISSSLYCSDLPIVQVTRPENMRDSYEDILRVLDQKNKKDGIETPYLDQEINELNEKTIGNIDFLAFYKGDDEKEVLEIEESSFSGRDEFHNLGEILEEGLNTYNQEEAEQLEQINVGPKQKIYFGNGNTAQDIIYLNKEKYAENKENLIANDNDRFILEGKYVIPYLTEETDLGWEGTKRYLNPLDISMEEYNEKIKGKTNEERLLYLQNKLNEGNITTYIEDGILYTKDDKGEKWPVLWNIQPIRYRFGSKVEEIVWEKINVYIPNSKLDSSYGNLAFSKDGNMYIEDNLDYEAEVKVHGKNVFNYVADYVYLSNRGQYFSNDIVQDLVDDYSKDRKQLENNEMTQDNFDAKWENIKTGYLEDKYKVANGEMTQAEFNSTWTTVSIDNTQLESDLQKVKDAEENLSKADEFARGASEMQKTMDPVKIKEAYDAEIAAIEKTQEKYPSWNGDKYKAETTVFYEAYKNLVEEENKFYEKYSSAVLNSDVLVAKKSKKLNLLGNGRINGTIDMGEGCNDLVISEAHDGEYGTNIIFGPYANIKNVDVLEAGRAYGKEDESSISGNYSMIIDIDENAKNEDGEINQHLFKNLDPDTIVRPQNIYFKDFKIGVIVSRLNKDEVLNMERPLYTVDNGETYDITFVSDSIAHELIERDKEKGIIDVNIKDEIDGLSSSENKVYQSIKSAGIIGKLSDTLTSSNKTTIFGGNRESEALEELKTLVDEMRIKNIYSYLGKVSKDSLDNFKYIPIERNKNIKQGSYVNGGSISKRFTKDGIKGNIYSGYGLYENDFKGLRLGGIIGGTSSSYKETNQKNFNEIFTDSKIEGMSAYVGSYLRKDFNEKLSVINGLGLQYGEYKTTRNLKNNYQNFDFTSKTNVNDLNLYSGLLYNIDLKNNMSLKLKGILSYDFVMQGKIQENEDILGMEVEKQNFNFLDGELGLGLSKILYSDNAISELIGEVSYKYGLVGYGDETLNGKIKDSTSDFKIERQKLDKDFAKFAIRYDVRRDSGLTYGLGGEFSKSKKDKEVVVKLNIGYTL